MYDIFYVSTRDIDPSLKERFPLLKTATSIKEAQKKSFTRMLWIIWDDVILNDEFDLSFNVPKWDEQYVHVFKNGEHYDGICLVPKNQSILDREEAYRFFVDKKEISIVASYPKPYDVFVVDSYDEYLAALESSTSDMFWISSRNLKLINDFKFDLYFSWHNTYDRNQNHVFQHIVADEILYDGIFLCSKNAKLSKKEIDYRFLVNKKEWPIVASTTADYDIIFISYNEPNADSNFKKLSQHYPRAKRIHGIKGIHNAHIEAAKISDTDMFWVVDGDAIINDNFKFEFEVSRYDKDIVYTWKSQNPINKLIYGYGGVKLLPKKLTLKMDTNSADMTTAISDKFTIVDQVSNITAFNTDPFNTWKSAFRECVKLSSKTIRGQIDTETDERLNIWCTLVDGDFAIHALRGANAGRIYGQENAANPAALSMINDFEWLEQQFKLTSVLR